MPDVTNSPVSTGYHWMHVMLPVWLPAEPGATLHTVLHVFIVPLGAAGSSMSKMDCVMLSQ